MAGAHESIAKPADWVQVHADRAALGEAAARDIAAELRRVLTAQGSARIVFAAAPSQRETLESLARSPGIDWSLVTAFHMDEYVGLAPQAPERFGTWLRHTLLDRLPFAAVHLVDPVPDGRREAGIGRSRPGGPERTARRYADLLAQAPVDVVCLGIGVNGHIAFNDPPVADFEDPLSVKVVVLDDVCRQQQVDDGCFASVADVPERAITLTVPMLMSGRRLFCMVPGPAKAPAVRSTVLGRLGTHCPSTVLRTHSGCTLYLDAQSAMDLTPSAAPAANSSTSTVTGAT